MKEYIINMIILYRNLKTWTGWILCNPFLTEDLSDCISDCIRRRYNCLYIFPLCGCVCTYNCDYCKYGYLQCMRKITNLTTHQFYMEQSARVNKHCHLLPMN